MAGVELPTVSETFVAHVAPYLANMATLITRTEEAQRAVEDLQRTISDLHGTDVTIRVNTEGIGTAAGLTGLTGGFDGVRRDIADISGDLIMQTALLREMATALGVVQRDTADSSADLMTQTALLGEMRDLWASNAALASVYNVTVRDAGTAAAAAGAGFRLWGTGIVLTANAIHWIIAGTAEFLAVAIPAAVALAAGMAVAAQGAQNAQIHFTALYDATEATALGLHQTVGTVLGLGDALQRAQDAANPGVYEVLGAAVNVAKTRFSDFAGLGLQVVHMFDEFAARVTVDMQGAVGTQLHDLLSKAATDLQDFGTVLGNLGHALLNFASAMPGLAEVLLTIAVVLSRVIEWVSELPAPLITAAMAMEEFYRWGGLVLTMLVRLTGGMAMMNEIAAGGGFITRFGAAVLTLATTFAQALTSVGSFLAGLGSGEGILARVGGAFQTAGAEVQGFAEALSPAAVAGMAAFVGAGLAVLMLLDRLRNSDQRFIDGINQQVASASSAAQVLGILAAGYTQAQGRIAEATASLQTYNAAEQQSGQAVAGFVTWLQQVAPPLGGAAAGALNFASSNNILARSVTTLGATLAGPIGMIADAFIPGASEAASKVDELRAAQQAWAGQAATIVGNLGLLSAKFHTTATGALALATAAGVNLTQGLTKGSVALQIAEQQVTNLKAGLVAMSAPANVIGADMNAIGLASALANSKVQTLNQSLDAFIAGTTSGMSGVAQFEAALHTMGHDTMATGIDITGAITRISADAAKMGYTLQGMGPKAQQSWQQFAAAVQQGNSVLDTMRTGMAEGVVSWGQYQSAIRATVGQLLPFAAGNKAALAMVSQLAQEAGLPATTSLKTLANWAGITGAKARNELARGMEKAVIGMSNLSTVARNLSVVVGSQLDASMAKAIVQASGLDQAYLRWATDVRNNAAPKTLQGDLSKIDQAQNFVNTATRKATTLLNNQTTALKDAATAVSTGTGKISAQAQAAKTAATSVLDHAAAMDRAMSSAASYGDRVQGAAGQTDTARAATDNLDTVVGRLDTIVRNAAGHVQAFGTQTTGAGDAAGTASGKVAQAAGSMQHAGNMAYTATGQVHGLAWAIAGLQSKTITITTNMVTTHTGRQAGGPVAAGIPYTVGEAGRELFVPWASGFILPHEDTERWLHAPAAAGGATVGHAAGGGGTTRLEAAVHTHVNVDGQELLHVLQPHVLTYNVRNGNPQSGTMSPLVSAARG